MGKLKQHTNTETPDRYRKIRVRHLSINVKRKNISSVQASELDPDPAKSS